MEASVSANIVLRQSIRGIQKEIDLRTWRICELVERINGNEKRFFKPVKNQLPVMMAALKLHREVERLRVIKQSLKQQL